MDYLFLLNHNLFANAIKIFMKTKFISNVILVIIFVQINIAKSLVHAKAAQKTIKN